MTPPQSATEERVDDQTEEQATSTRPTDAGSVGSAVDAMTAQYKNLKESQILLMQSLGGPQAFVAHVAPRVLNHFAGQWTERQVLSETTAGWAAADERLAQCARCPADGGACDGSLAALAPGLTVLQGATPSGIEFLPCAKWERFLSLGRMRNAGVPESLVRMTLDHLFERQDGYPLRDGVRRWLGAVRRREPVPSFLLTSGMAQRRTEFLAAVTHHLVMSARLRVHYTFGPKLAVELRDYYDQGTSGTDPLERCALADVLVFDFLDPEPASREKWKPWFVERIDQMLWKRLGEMKPTIISSRMNVEEFSKHFTYASLFTIEEISITDPNFGPFRHS